MSRTKRTEPIDGRRTVRMNGWRALGCATLLGCALHARAQNTLHLLVLDSASAEPVIGAGAVLVGTGHSGTSDLDGRVTLAHVPDGTHALRVAAMGYGTAERTITLPGADSVLTVRLANGNGQLEEVVVSATRTNSRIGDAPQKIEVLGEEELHEESSLKPGNVASLIGDISSVQIQQTSGVSGASTVRMQGLDGRYTLLLRDGMPAFGGLSGGFDLLRIPPLDLQRVELLKGPSSTFNGGGAIAGAINFVSKDPADSLGGMVLLNRASLGETNVNVYASGPIGKAGFTLFGGSTLQDAVDVNGDGYSDLATVRTHVLHPEVFLQPGAHSKLRIGGLYQHDERTGGNMDALGAPSDTTRYFLRTTGERKGIDAQFESALDPTSTLVVKGTINDYTQNDRTNFGTAVHAQRNHYAEAYWDRSSARRTWVIGGNYAGSRLTGDGIRPQDLSTVGAFAQFALHRKRWPEIDLGLRADKPQGYDVQVLPSIAAMYKLSSTVTLRANAGTGYQLPDRSRNYGLVTEGLIASDVAPGTKPESSLGGTVEWTWKRSLGEHTFLFVDQTFFATHIDRPLAVSVVSGTATLFNPGGTTLTRGIDNYVRLTHGPTELYLGYTYTLPEATNAGYTYVVAYTPQHRGAMTLGHEFDEHWRAGIEASWSGQQTRLDGTPTRDQLFMAAMVGYANGRWNVALNGENITDTRQTRWEDIVSGTAARPVFAPLWAPIDGRVLNLSVLYHFGWRKG